MKKRGPKPLVSHEERVNELKKHSVFDEKGCVKKESDPVWAIISQNISEKDPLKTITLRNLQTYVAQNRNNVQKELRRENSEEHVLVSVKSTKNAIQKHSDTEKILLSIKNNVLYRSIVRKICIHPFAIYHWSLEAIDYIKELPKYSQFVFAPIGNFCNDFVAPDNSTSSAITLYTFGVEVNENLIPLCQLSSAKNGAALLKRFFRELLRSKLSIPKVFITDFDLNYYGVANAVFNINVSIEEYLMMCFLYLTKKVRYYHYLSLELI